MIDAVRLSSSGFSDFATQQLAGTWVVYMCHLAVDACYTGSHLSLSVSLFLSKFAYKLFLDLSFACISSHHVIPIFSSSLFLCAEGSFSYEHGYGVHDVYDPITLLE